MAAVKMDGKALAEQVKEAVHREAAALPRKPGLAVVLVGDNPASRVYVDGKKRDCAQCGIYSEEYALPAGAGQAQLLELIDALNARAEIDGILVQLPLPEQLEEQELLRRIRPDKDVDCFHPCNVGRLLLGQAGFQPCTPAGVMRLLEAYQVDPAGRHCVIVGRSNIVGKPQALMMLQKNATVTICHTATRNLAEECLRADILIAAAGRAGLIRADMVKEGAVVIDVAMNRDSAGKLCGDVERAAWERAAFMTPVPGGVGPMTRAMLMENTLYAAREHLSRRA